LEEIIGVIKMKSHRGKALIEIFPGLQLLAKTN
jgi:hypothetical protein